MDFQTQEIPLNKLALHEKNVRARSPETYEAEDITVLAASIAAIGLIQPLIVIDLGKGQYGVIAGGRRLAALKALAADKEAKAFKATTPVACRVMPEGTDLTTALSFAENATQAPMKPIDEFEAFNAMLDEGMSVEQIARTFGVESRRVNERLRYARIAAPIRAACRAGEITLDTMKCFANHPDTDVQLSVYDSLKESDDLYAYKIRDALSTRGIRAKDAKARAVREAYEARGGEIVRDLIDEESILTDESLIEEILAEQLQAAADAARIEHGFAWARTMPRHDWEEMRKFGRVYPDISEIEGEAAERLEAIETRMTEIAETLEDADDQPDEDSYEALEGEYQSLEDEKSALIAASERFRPEDAARAGVIASWQSGEIVLHLGLVHPEEVKAKAGTAGAGGGAPGGTGGTKETAPDALVIKDAMKADLGVERAIALGAALIGMPGLALDIALYKIVTDIYGRGGPVSHGLGISASRGDRPHAKPDEIDPTAKNLLHALEEELGMDWLSDGEIGDAEAFARFCGLEAETKTRMVALAVAHGLKSSTARDASRWNPDLLAILEPEIMPDVRAFWRPTGGSFFMRIPKAQLLRILRVDLKMPDEAANLASSKKNDVVAFMEKLFAEPFATLKPEQREAVARWAPPGMQTITSIDEGEKDETDDTGAIEDVSEEDDASGAEAESDENPDDGLREDIAFEDDGVPDDASQDAAIAAE